MDVNMLQNMKRRFKSLRKLAEENNGYIQPTLYDVEILEVLELAINIATTKELLK